MSTFVHLHTLDLRLHDSPSLHLAHDPSSSISSSIKHFLPVYIFDERALDLSQLPGSRAPPSAKSNAPGQYQGHGQPKPGPINTRSAPRSRVANFHRTSPQRLWFLLQAVYSLRDSYRSSGGDMLIGYGKIELLLPELLKQVGDIAGVWAQEEYTLEEARSLERLRKALPDGVKLHLNQSKTLIPPKHLPFNPSDETPDVYTQFRKRVEGLGLHLDGGMLVEPLHTASWSHSKSVDGIDVRVGSKETKLKPFPDVPKGEGWIKKDSELDSAEGMYAALVQPLIDSPPIGGWSSTAKGNRPPSLHSSSAIPFDGGEASALSRLEDYIGHPDGAQEGESSHQNGSRGGQWVGGEKAKSYKSTRNGLLGEAFSTKFASFLALGCLSTREVGWRVGQLLEVVGKDKDTRNNVYWIIFELLWRDYFQFVTLHYSSKPSSLFDPTGFSSQIKNFGGERPNPSDWHYPNWDDPSDPARRWCEGKTGVPFIDAAMIDLRETGYMSNRSRQNVASFLTKDLYVDWRVGAEFFEMHLVDYDTCSNWGNWQYQAGVGNDARSSRQFNPIKQAGDYDSHGEYVRTWLPQLKDLPNDVVQTPWVLNSSIEGYPNRPIVENPSWKKFYGGKKGGRGGGHRGGGGRGGGHRNGGFGHGRGRGGHGSHGGRGGGSQS